MRRLIVLALVFVASGCSGSPAPPEKVTYQEWKRDFERYRREDDERDSRPGVRREREKVLARRWAVTEEGLEFRGPEYVRAAREVEMSKEDAAEVNELLSRLKKLEERADREGWRNSGQFGDAVKDYCDTLIGEPRPADYDEGPEDPPDAN